MAVIVAAVLYAGVAAHKGAAPALDDVARLSDALRVQETLPPGHPPIPSLGLPPGHPPIAPLELPPGHPPLPWLRHGCPGGGFAPGFGDSDGVVAEPPEVVST